MDAGSPDRDWSGEGDGYVGRKRPARKYEARLILCKVAEGEFSVLCPSGKVAAGTSLVWHAQWAAAAQRQDTGSNAVAHDAACRALETAGCYDQLNDVGPATVELMARRFRTAEEDL